MANFFADNFSQCAALAVFLLALCPMIESKIAIPFALSSVLWGDYTLSPLVAFVVAFAGSMLPSIFIILLARFIKNRTSGFVYDKFTTFVSKHYQNRVENVSSKSSVLRKCMAVATFVAVPLPLTGTYAGSIISGFTNLKIWQCFLSVLIGELVSCGVILALCLLFENSAFYVLLASVCLLLVFLLANFVVTLVSKIKKKRDVNSSFKD